MTSPPNPISSLRSLSPCPLWSVESGWFLLIESRRRISRISLCINVDLIRSHSAAHRLSSSLPGALCVAMCAVIRRHSSPTCGSTPETRTTTMSKLTKPLMRPSPRAAGKRISQCRNYCTVLQLSFLYLEMCLVYSLAVYCSVLLYCVLSND